MKPFSILSHITNYII
jgi:hypothetical protein